MKKTRHTEEQIAFALKQAETGTSVAEVIRRMGISEQTFYRWKKVYGGLGVGEFVSITGPSSSRRRSTAGPTRTASRWTSAGRASLRTMPSWSRSTGAFGTSA